MGKEEMKKHTESESKRAKEVDLQKKSKKEGKNQTDIKERKIVEVVSKDVTHESKKEDSTKQKETTKKSQTDETKIQKEHSSTQDAEHNEVKKTKQQSKEKNIISKEIDMKKMICVHDVDISSACDTCDDNQKTFERCASIKPDIDKDDRKEDSKQSESMTNRRTTDGSNTQEIKSIQGTKDKPKIDMNSQFCIHDISLKEVCAICVDNVKSLDRKAIKKGTENSKPENMKVLKETDSTLGATYCPITEKEKLTQESSEKEENTFSTKEKRVEKSKEIKPKNSEKYQEENPDISEKSQDKIKDQVIPI